MASTASAPEADLNLDRPASGQGENSHNCFVTASSSTPRSTSFPVLLLTLSGTFLYCLIFRNCCLHYLCISLHCRIRDILGAGILWFLGWSYFVWILFLIWTSVLGILFLESTGRLIISHERQQTSLFKNAGGCKREKMRAALSH